MIISDKRYPSLPEGFPEENFRKEAFRKEIIKIKAMLAEICRHRFF